MSLSSFHVVPADKITTIRAYAPILLERKAATIRKTMDDEKASGVATRISMDSANKQCAYLIFLSFPAYIYLAVGRPYSTRILSVRSEC